MTTLAQLRRTSARSRLSGRAALHTAPPTSVTVVSACHLCRLPMTTPGACAGRSPAEQNAGVGHESVQYTTNRAARRQRFLRDAASGQRIGRARPRAHILQSRARLTRLRLAHLRDWQAMVGASDQAKRRILAQRAAADTRKARRDARPGRLRAGLYQTAWVTARAVKRAELLAAREQAVAQADGVIARMRARRGAA